MDAVEAGDIRIDGDTLSSYLYPPGCPQTDDSQEDPDLEDGLFLGDMVLRVSVQFAHLIVNQHNHVAVVDNDLS
jgi:hypothetical protein